MTLAEVPPAVLPGTPERFPIPPGELIAKAQQLLRDGSGVKQPELLADNFRFEFPIVSLSKKVTPGPFNMLQAASHGAASGTDLLLSLPREFVICREI